MPKEHKCVLIGDSNRVRFDLLNGILQEKFGASAINAETFEELKAKARDFEGRHILVAEDLPYSESILGCFPANYLLSLRDARLGDSIALITSKAEPEVLPLYLASGGYLRIPASPPMPEYLEKIALELQSVLGLEPRQTDLSERPTARPEQAKPQVARGNRRVSTRTKQSQALPKIHLEDSLGLRILVQSLSRGGSLEEGKRRLGRLIQRFGFPGSMFEIRGVGQGLSGAIIFRVVPSKETGLIGRFILKVTPQSQKEKIRREVHQYLIAAPGLKIETFSSHVPDLKLPVHPCNTTHPDLKYVTKDGESLALCYDFLGGEVMGRVIDLEKALTAGSKELAEMTKGRPISLNSNSPAAVREFREEVLRVMLTFLCKFWYAHPDKVCRQKSRLWENQEVPDNKSMSVPPYRLWRRRKESILRFLASKDAQIGKSFLPSRWWNIEERVVQFLENSGGNTHVRLLDKKVPVLLSPSHGDLNANNIFLWLERADHPFLIDFPFYQESGHAMQDFARLEVEIKFALMDRQEDSSQEKLPGLDLTPSQVPLWQEMEEHLLSPSWAEPKKKWRGKERRKTVELCLGLVQSVRANAKQVQEQKLGESNIPEFHEEYLPALLYHTLQAIGWPSLSIFKRLLAVYSAASILDRLEALG